MKFGKRYDDRLPALNWFRWFAWYPVRLDDGRLAWLETVMRERCADDSIYFGYRSAKP